MTNTVLQTKLHIPPLRSALVSRSRLLEKLNSGQNGKLTLVSAPAGFGKTILVTEWVNQKDEGLKDEKSAVHPSRVAWLSLDEGDNDLSRFWQYIVAALRSALKQNDLGAGMMSAFQSPIEEALAGFINELTTLADPITLVLDDYHVIDTQAIHHSLAFLLDHMPPNLHLVIASRTNPPLLLARLRVRHQMTELTSEALRFTPEETAVFLNDVMGLNISAEDVAALEARTEGWIAGLQVAALSLQGHTDKTAFIRQFSGSHRHLLDYLAEEVLQQQPPAVQSFLLYTSILDRLTAPLCDEVMKHDGRPQADSQAMLARLEKANLFLVTLDDERRWYRYHHLFADFLRGRLREIEPKIIPLLHKRAADWHEAQGLEEMAVGHALAAANYEQAARLLEQMARTGWRDSRGGTFLRWLQALPEEMVHARPRLALHYAWCLLQTVQFETVVSLLDTAESSLKQAADRLPPTLPSYSTALLGEIEAMRAVLACYRGDIAEAMSRSRQALAQLPQDDVHMRGLVASNIAMNIGDEASARGDFSKAVQIYQEVIATGRAAKAPQITAYALNRLTQLHLMQGALRQAADTVKQVFVLLEDESLPAERGIAHMNQAELSYQWNHLEEARHHWQTGIEQIEPVRDVPAAYAALAFVLQAQGEPGAARGMMQQATGMAQMTNITWVASGVAAMSALLVLRQSDPEAAGRWADTCGLDVGDDINITRVPEYAILARIELARGNGERALALLNWLHDFVARIGLHGRVVELLALQALTLKAQGEQSEALTKLRQALNQAESEGYIRLFVDEGDPMAELLATAVDQGVQPTDFAQTLLACLKLAETSLVPPLLDPLSERELDVLRLLASDLNSSQIADELTIAVSTVRSHIKNIYSKLDAHSRYEAVIRARELSLL